MFLPIGLGTWVARLPWATLTLAVCVMVYSILEFPIIQSLDKTSGEYSQSKEYREKIKAAIAEACHSEGKPEEFCSYVKGLVADSGSDREMRRSLRKKRREYDSISDKVKFSRDVASVLTKFKKDLDSDNPPPAIASLKEVRAKLLGEVKKAAAAEGLLGPSNFGLLPLIRHQFQHQNYGHLIGNVFMLIAFGIYVEQIAGGIVLMLIFLFGGFIAGAAQIFGGADVAYMIGASGSVSAVAGAFYSFFFRKELCVWFSFMLFYNRRIFMPVSFALPIVYILHDLTAVSVGEKSSVAHLAHIGGFIFGIAIGAHLISKIKRKDDELYPFEQSILNEAARHEEREARVAAYRRLIRYNPANVHALEALLGEMYQENSKLIDDSIPQIRAGFARVQSSLGRVKQPLLLRLISNLPLNLTINHVSKPMGGKLLITLAHNALTRQQPLAALRIMEAFLYWHPKSKKATHVRQSLREVISENIEDKGLQTYISLFPNGILDREFSNVYASSVISNEGEQYVSRKSA